ncbi:MAG: FHA domain-containing protein [Burkholderiaceae bacterium]
MHPTIVFVDLTGSSAAYESFENELVAGMVSRITHWVSRVCDAYRGRTIKLLGDGVLLQFPARIHALSAAVFLQQRYAGYLGALPKALRLAMKIGLATGSIVQIEADSYGDPVNLAARLCDMAGADTIWADESVFEGASAGQAASAPAADAAGVRILSWLEVRRRPLGLMRIPGLTQPRSVFQVLWGADVCADQLTRPGNLADLQAQTQAAAQPRIKLRWLDQSKVFDAGTDKIRIGRTTDNDLVIADQRVSRQHACIEWQDGAYVLTDLSSYGTTVRFADAAGPEVPLRRNACLLHSSGEIALGGQFSDFTAPVLAFEVQRQEGTQPLAGPLPLFGVT